MTLPKLQTVSGFTESVFAHAVALNQNGRLRSTIYCFRNIVYILNQDHTVLLRFELPKGVGNHFSEPVCFEANEYTSKKFYTEKGRVYFVDNIGPWEKKKCCRSPKFTPLDVNKMYKRYAEAYKPSNTITLRGDKLPDFEDDLSHTEFLFEDGGFRIVQRNIFSGTVTEWKMGISNEYVSMQPIGIRTNDLMALFAFGKKTIELSFTADNVMWINTKNDALGSYKMTGIVSQCIYDELGKE